MPVSGTPEKGAIFVLFTKPRDQFWKNLLTQYKILARGWIRAVDGLLRGTVRALDAVVLILWSLRFQPSLSPQMRSGEAMNKGSPGQPERRRRTRAAVHWQVHWHNVEHLGTVISTTEDLSSGGLCCAVPFRLVAGEIRTCTLQMPTHYSTKDTQVCSLECRMRVVWVTETDQPDTYRAGCQIEDYACIVPVMRWCSSQVAGALRHS